MIDWLNANGILVTGIATSLIALSSIITAVLTYFLTKENSLLRKKETQPEVLAYLKPSVPGGLKGSIYDLVVGNFGRGPAFNVKLEIRIYGNVGKIHEIGVIPQGERIVSAFGVTEGMLKDHTAWSHVATIKYEDLKGKSFEQTRPLRVSTLEQMEVV